MVEHKYVANSYFTIKIVLYKHDANRIVSLQLKPWYKLSQLKLHDEFCESEDFAACLFCKFNFEQLITNSNSSL